MQRLAVLFAGLVTIAALRGTARAQTGQKCDSLVALVRGLSEVRRQDSIMVAEHQRAGAAFTVKYERVDRRRKLYLSTTSGAGAVAIGLALVLILRRD